METFNQIGPWITGVLLLAIVVFFSVFYIVKLLKAKKISMATERHVAANDNSTISKEQRKKLKDEIVHDIVADITPVLEKRLEKAF